MTHIILRRAIFIGIISNASMTMTWMAGGWIRPSLTTLIQSRGHGYQDLSWVVSKSALRLSIADSGRGLRSSAQGIRQEACVYSHPFRIFGQQRYGCNVWTGDVASTWETLRNQIPALLNFTLTGNPNSNSDIGGFFAGAYNKSYGDNSAVKNPQFQELFVRWMQFGAFTPMMRSHGADIKREIYYFGNRGETVFDAVEDAIKLRYSLLPYIYSTSWDVSRHNSSFMRPLMMDFPKDRNGWDCGDQFMFGRNIPCSPRW